MKSLIPKTVDSLLCKKSTKSHKTTVVMAKLPGGVIKFAGYAIPKKSLKADYAIAIKSLSADGVSAQKIAEMLDISLSYVYELRKR